MIKVIIIFLVILIIYSCKPTLPTTSLDGLTFNFIEIKDPFELTVTEFYKNSAACSTEALPYALIVGSTSNNKLPPTISVLSYCDNRIFTKNETLTIKPTINPMDRTNIKPLYFIKDTTINRVNIRWLIGSDNPAIWGTPN